MEYVVCCSTVEMKYRKTTGGCKVIKNDSIPISSVDDWMNDVAEKDNFKSFISVKIVNVHVRPLHSLESDTESDEDEDSSVSQ